LSETFRRDHPDFEVRVNLEGADRARLHASIGAGRVGAVEFLKGSESLLVPLGTGDQVRVAFAQTFELQLSFAVLNLAPRGRINLQVSIWVKDLPLQVIPQAGWLGLELTDDLTAW